MKITNFLVLYLTAASIANGQGTFVYDQQSSTEGNYGEGGAYIQQNQPIGQSFTPDLSMVGFVRLYISNGYLGNVSSANIYVNLLANSISGTVLDQSESVTIPGGALFASPVDFIFATPVSVTPGVTYFFQPVVSNNNNLAVTGDLGGLNYSYSGGTAYFNGTASPNEDLWFREGIVVPEPSPSWLVLLGSGILFFVRRLIHR